MEKTAKIINGKKIAEEFCESMKKEISELKKRGIFPKIALINANNDPASEIYLSKKEKLAESLGIKSETYKFPENTTEEIVENTISKLNADKNVHAILLQSPVAKGLDFKKLLNLISDEKDVDGLTLKNQGRLFAGDPEIVPCTPLGILHLIKTVRKNIQGLHAVILGRSQIVGRPLISLLLNENCSVTALHSYSQNVSEISRTADILISAIGKPKFVGKDFIKPGAIVIDVGINRIQNPDGTRKIVGDVNFDEAIEIAEAVTPVPNGVGPMTVAYLIYNTVKLAEKTLR